MIALFLAGMFMTGAMYFPARNADKADARPCYCGGLYDCGNDTCRCDCDKDGAPYSQADVTAGYINPSQARLAAWSQKQEVTR